MSDYRTTEGAPTTDTDLERLIFYALCGYWTDDWDKVKVNKLHIPCCPECRAQGFQATAGEWFHGADQYEYNQNKPRYTEFLRATKEHCFGKEFHNESEYERWLKQN